jgi:transcriptional regulator with XRE-family HTH domain
MEDVRVGMWIRAARLRLGLRQSDVARVAHVSAESVSRSERGSLSRMTVPTLRAIAGAVGIELGFVARSTRLGDLDRQIDRAHADLVEAVVARLVGAGWRVWTEYSFNYYGDRGSVDVLAWHAGRRALLIVEVKSELRDVQRTLRSLDVKRRVVPGRVRAERGLTPAAVGVVLVLPETSTDRGFVARFRALFAAALPARNVAVRQWVAAPERDLRGIWFLRVSPEALLTQRIRGRRRVRLSKAAVAAIAAAGSERGSGNRKGWFETPAATCASRPAELGIAAAPWETRRERSGRVGAAAGGRVVMGRPGPRLTPERPNR